jgi:APA family basic amino acid/polyamine antiporter
LNSERACESVSAGVIHSWSSANLLSNRFLACQKNRRLLKIPGSRAVWYNPLVPDSKANLVRAIGRFSLAALMVNIMIGGGVFEVPASVAGLLGSQSPTAYLVAAVGMGVIAACLAEVASRFQQVGGPYLYAKVAFGRFLGLQVGWLLWLTRVSAAAAVVNVFLDYAQPFFPQAKEPVYRIVIVTILIGSLAAINVRGVRIGTQISDLLTVAKLLPLVIFLIGGFSFIRTHPSLLPDITGPYPIRAWINAVVLIVFAYSGFEAALIPAGEVKNPTRDTPVALMTAMIVVTVAYSLLQVVVIRVLANPAQTNFPLLAAARVMGNGSMAAIISAGALFSSIGYFAANMIATPRITFALAEQGDFPRWFAAIHPRYRTPHTSVLAFAAVVWLLSLGGTFRGNAVLSATTRLVVYGMSCAALPVLRRKLPKQPGFHLPGGVVFAVLGFAFAMILVSRMGKAELVALAVTIVIAFLNWLAIRRMRSNS